MYDNVNYFVAYAVKGLSLNLKKVGSNLDITNNLIYFINKFSKIVSKIFSLKISAELAKISVQSRTFHTTTGREYWFGRTEHSGRVDGKSAKSIDHPSGNELEVTRYGIDNPELPE